MACSPPAPCCCCEVPGTTPSPFASPMTAAAWALAPQAQPAMPPWSLRGRPRPPSWRCPPFPCWTSPPMGGNVTLALPPPPFSPTSIMQAYLTRVFTLTFALNVSSPYAWGLVPVAVTVIPVPPPPVCTAQSRTLYTTTTTTRCPSFPPGPPGGRVHRGLHSLVLWPALPQVQHHPHNGAGCGGGGGWRAFVLPVVVTDNNGRTGSCMLTIALTPVPKPPTWVGTGAAALGRWAWNLTEGTLAVGGRGRGRGGGAPRAACLAPQPSPLPSMAVERSASPPWGGGGRLPAALFLCH
jgi:hypothetical protein